MAEITIHSAPATFEAHGANNIAYVGRITSERGVVTKVEADVCRAYTDTDPDGNEVESREVIGRLVYDRGNITNAQRNVLPYIAEFVGIIDQLNDNDNGTDNNGI